MKKIVILLTILSLVLALVVSCGQKEAEETDKVPTEVKQAEQMDSTRMDSAAEAMDSAATEMVDSAAAEATEAVEGQ